VLFSPAGTIDASVLLRSGNVDIVNTFWYDTGDYMTSGLLEDLSVMFQYDVSGSLNRILPALRNQLFTSDGELPILPVGFRSYVLFPHEGVTIHQAEEIPKEWTWYEANDWLENDFKDNNTEMFLYQSAYNFTENFLLLDYLQYYYSDISKKILTDSPVLREILQVSKFFLDSGRIPGIHWLPMDPSGVEWDPENANPLMDRGYLGNTVLNYNTLMTTKGQAYPLPHIEGAEGKNVWIYSGFGINKASSTSTKLAAWELLKNLMSDEIQNGGLLGSEATSMIAEFTREGVARSYYGEVISKASKAEAYRLIDSITDEQVAEYNEARLNYYDDITALVFRPGRNSGTYRAFRGAIPYFKDEISFEECLEVISMLK
jgi:ABC-type glycerol-3-phosphate transport system substrate-binding protein